LGKGIDYDKTVDKDHGHLEIREYWTISDMNNLQQLRGFGNGKNFQTVSRIRFQRKIGE
jgi:hypothetical protein